MDIVNGDLTLAGDWTLTLADAGGTAEADDKFYLFTGFTSHSGDIIPDIDTGLMGPRWSISNLTFGVDPGGLYMTGLETTVIPEPMTMLAVALGVAGLGGYIRKRRRA